MGYILLFIIAVVVLFVVVVLLLPQPARQKVVGICEAAIGQAAKKRENKEKILSLLAEKARSSPSGQGELSNADIREALGVSRRSVSGYMEELEQEGRVEQVGDAGRGVVYRLK